VQEYIKINPTDQILIFDGYYKNNVRHGDGTLYEYQNKQLVMKY